MSSSMFYCEHCKTTMTGSEPYKTHIEGKKHLKKLKAMGIASGTETTTTSSKPDLGQFAKASNQGNIPSGQGNIPLDQGNNLQRQPESMNAANILGTSNVDPVMNAVKANLLGKLPLKRMAYEGKCDVCSVEYTSKSHEEQHLSGKKHQKKVQAKEAKEGMNAATLYCGFCNIHVNSVEQMDQHRSGTSHNKKVASAKEVQQEVQLEMKLPHSAPKKRFVPSSATEIWDSQIMPPPPLPDMKLLPYDQ